MNTKSIYLKMILLAFTMAFYLPSFANDTDIATAPKIETKEEYKAAVEALVKRKDALIEAKKNATSAAERKQIREDIQDIKKEAKYLKQQEINGGIYIGGGALIILVLLLLLL